MWEFQGYKGVILGALGVVGVGDGWGVLVILGGCGGF